MAFGMQLGTQQAMAPTRGLARKGARQYGSSIRGGPRVSASSVTDGGGISTDNDAARARSQAERAAAANAQQQEEPEMEGPPEPEEYGEATRPPSLGGGKMGQGIDFSARDAKYKELDELYRQQVSEHDRTSGYLMEGLFGPSSGSKRINLKMRQLQEQIAREDRLAREAAAQAAVTSDPWEDLPYVGAQGEALERHRATQEVRPLTYATTVRQEEPGPWVPGAIEEPYSEATRRFPAKPRQIVEKEVGARFDEGSDARRLAAELAVTKAKTEGDLRVKAAEGEERRRTEGTQHGFKLKEFEKDADAKVRAAVEIAEKAGGSNPVKKESDFVGLMHDIVGESVYQGLPGEQKAQYNQVVRRSLANIYGKGAAPTGGAPKAGGGSAPAGAPKPGDVMGGYRFKGGNPRDKANWEPAGGR